MSSPPLDFVFISYSHKDSKWLEPVKIFLDPYMQSQGLRTWADSDIQVGDRWRREIEAALERAGIGILLVTQHFLTSEFIKNVELPALCDAADQCLLTLVPIPISASTYEVTRLADYQWPRNPEEPLDLLPEEQRHRELVQIVRKIVKVATEAARKTASPARPASRVERKPVEQLVPSSVAHPGKLHGLPDLPPHYLPRPEDLSRLKEALLAGAEGAVGITAALRLGLHGQGGLGKSVLAAALARDEDVRRAFPDGVYWLTIGQSPDLLRLQAELVGALGGEAAAVTSAEEGRRALQEHLGDRSCLLILDDVWQIGHARAFDVLGGKSRLLVTTRDATVLTALGAREEPIERLPEDTALKLLARWAGRDAHTLPQAAREVARECGYLPLALSVAGARVRDGVSWEDLLAALERGQLEFLDHPYGNVFRSMRPSVDALPDEERQRYIELAVFPEDVPIPEAMVVRLWSRTAGLEPHTSRTLIAKLESKALLERSGTETQREIVLHDLQHDFLRLLVDDLPALHNELLAAMAEELPAQRRNGPGWHLLPNTELYSWLHLAEHLVAAGRSEELRELLFDYRWLEAKLPAVGISALLSDFSVFSHDRDLSLVAATLRMSAHVLATDVSQLPPQLIGRLLSVDMPQIHTFLDRVKPSSAREWLRPLSASLDAPSSGLVRTLLGHSSWVSAVAVTPDGRRAISGSWDNTLKVWDLESGEEIRTLQGHSDSVNAVAVTPDGRRAISGSDDQTLKVWELQTGRVIASFTADAPVLCCAAAPNSITMVAGDALGKVHFLRLQSPVANLRH